MKKLMIFFVFFSVISFAFNQNNYKAVFSSKEINTKKGLFNEITMSLQLEQPSRLYQVTGKLKVPAPFILGDEVIIDTLKERSVLISIGLPCSYTPTPSEEKIKFEIEGTTKVDFPDLIFKISATQQEISIEVKSEEISAGSYGLYYVAEGEQLRNVDPITINVQKTEGREGTLFNSLVIPPYNQYRNVMHLKSSFSTPLLNQGEMVGDQKGTASIVNECFMTKATISFKINNKGLPIMNEKTKQDLFNSLFINHVLLLDYVIINREIQSFPSILTCSLQKQIKSTDEVLNKLRNINDFAKTTNENFRVRQEFIKSESLSEIIFNRVNRFGKELKLVCLLEDMNREKEKVKSIYFIAGNNDTDDRKLVIQTMSPPSSSCAIWSFESAFDDPRNFQMKAANYCSEHFATLNRNKELSLSTDNGCLQCEANSYIDGTLDKPQKAICIRSRPDCPTSFEGNLTTEFFKVVDEMDSKEKIKTLLGIDTSKVETTEKYNDNDEVDTKGVKVSYNDSDGEEFSINIFNDLSRSISCLIKKEALRYIPSRLLNIDFDANSLLLIFKAKETKTVTLSFEKDRSGLGYDNKPYNVFFKCFSIANEGHYYGPKPFIGFTVLRNDIKPTKEDPAPKENCDEKPYISECLKRIYHKPLPFKNLSLVPQAVPELEAFKILSYPYQKVMIETELTKFEKLTLKIDVMFEALSITQLLSTLDCKATDNYSNCRSFKTTSVSRLIQIIQKHFFTVNSIPCNFLIKNFFRTSDLTTHNIFRFLFILFHLGNNPETFSATTYPLIFEMTHCMYSFKDHFFLYFDKQVLLNETKEDFLQLFLSHSLNLIEVINHLEADSLISPTGKEIINEPLVQQHKADIETILKDILLTNITSFTYENFYYVNLKRSDYFKNEADHSRSQGLIPHEESFKSSSSSPSSYYFDDLKIILSLEPFDIFNQTTSASHIAFNIWKQYPLLSMKTLNYSLHAVSFKVYQTEKKAEKEEIEIKEIKNLKVDSHPMIKYDYSMVNETFKLGYMFDSEAKEFINNFTSYKNLSRNKISLGEITLEKVGDFTIGIGEKIPESLKDDNVLMIILLSVGGVVLLGIFGFFIFKYYKKKKQPDSPQIKQLIPGELNEK